MGRDIDAVFQHEGGIENLEDMWQAAFAWLGSDGYDSAQKPDFELYPSGISPLDAKTGIEVWLGVVARDA